MILGPSKDIWQISENYLPILEVSVVIWKLYKNEYKTKIKKKIKKEEKAREQISAGEKNPEKRIKWVLTNINISLTYGGHCDRPLYTLCDLHNDPTI